MDYHVRQMITVAETTEFIKQAGKLINDDERQNLISYLADNPMTGVVIEGTGGIRKLRWARRGMGKSSGVRVIYYYYNERMPLYLLTIYGKGEKANITASEKSELSKLVKLLVGFWIKKK